MPFDLFYGKYRKTENDHNIPGLAMLSRPSIQTNDTGSRHPWDRIALDPRAVIQIGNEDFFERKNSGFFHEQAVDRDTAFIMEIRIRNRRAMNLRFQHGSVHVDLRPSLILDAERLAQHMIVN